MLFIELMPVEKPQIKDIVFIELEYMQFTRHCVQIWPVYQEKNKDTG